MGWGLLADRWSRVKFFSVPSPPGVLCLLPHCDTKRMLIPTVSSFLFLSPWEMLVPDCHLTVLREVIINEILSIIPAHLGCLYSSALPEPSLLGPTAPQGGE